MKKTITQSTNWLTAGLSAEELLAKKTLAIIAADIQLKRIEMGLDQKQFAKLLGVSQGMVSRWESGTYNFTISTLVNICEKLDLSFEPQITAKETEVFAETISMMAFDFTGAEYSGNRTEEFGSWKPNRKRTEAGAAA